MEKPILFNTEMVQAILEGRKTTTRRVIKYSDGRTPESFARDKFYGLVDELNNKHGLFAGFYQDSDVFIYEGEQQIDAIYFKAPYAVGDILWVRETWNNFADDDGDNYVYRADGGWDELSWHPSIHMPRAAARIFLRVTCVRAERLQDITEGGAEKEGCKGVRCDCNGMACACTDCYNTGWLEPPILNFLQLWDSTIKKSDIDRYGWDANPWVWVIEFERLEGHGW